MFGSSSPFGQSSNRPFGSPSVFGQNNNNNPFAQKPFGSQTGSSIFGGTSTGVFGTQASSPIGSTSVFGASSSPAFGSSVFGQKHLVDLDPLLPNQVHLEARFSNHNLCLGTVYLGHQLLVIQVNLRLVHQVPLLFLGFGPNRCARNRFCMEIRTEQI